MRKKIMNVVLFLAVLAAALGMTLYVGNSAASVLIYNFIFLGIIAVVYIVGLLGDPQAADQPGGFCRAAFPDRAGLRSIRHFGGRAGGCL